MIENLLGKIMDFLLSLIFGLQLSNSIHQKMIEESHQKRKRGRPKKGVYFIPALVMRDIRQDQLTRLITSNIMDAEKIRELLTELMNLQQSNCVSSTTAIPDSQWFVYCRIILFFYLSSFKEILFVLFLYLILPNFFF